MIPLCVHVAQRRAAQERLCAAMARWLDNQQHWTALDDDAIVLETRAIDGTGEFHITAGMIRRATGQKNLQPEDNR